MPLLTRIDALRKQRAEYLAKPGKRAAEALYEIDMECRELLFGDVADVLPIAIKFIESVANDRDDRASPGLKEEARAALEKLKGTTR